VSLTVTMFLILLAASVVVVSLMVLFPLIDLAFEKKKVPLPYRWQPTCARRGTGNRDDRGSC
jgi:hypothetical protein